MTRLPHDSQPPHQSTDRAGAEREIQPPTNMTGTDNSAVPPSDDGSLLGLLTYGLTLPERTARSASAVVGGLVNETAARVIPSVFRTSRSYTVFVQQALDMMVHDVGGVTTNDDGETTAEGQLAQKAVGGLLDVAGAATLHLSPITVLAVFSDLAYGSSQYLKELSEELKREGIIDAESSIDHVNDLVNALQKTSNRAADAMDTPPISITGITTTIAQLSEEISNVDPRKLMPQSEVARMWQEMESAATEADVGLWDVSTTMTMFAMNRISLTTRGALSSVSVASNLFDQHIVGHYSDALDEISEHGLYATLSQASTPYLDAVWQNFADERETWTEELITGRMIGKAWRGVRGWLTSSDDDSESLEEPIADGQRELSSEPTPIDSSSNRPSTSNQ
ncbi:MAG: hypothetical protein HKN47_22735 [Pirellulaceae bacterium]|nr:hypothetical protein [Pirellulaceae bacterium]